MLVLFQFLTIALSPLYIIRWKISLPLFGHLFSVPMTLLEVLLLVTIGLAIYEFIKQDYPWKKLRTPFDLWIGLFLIVAILETVLSVNKIGGIGILKAYFIEPILFFYTLVFVGKTKGMKHILIGLVTAGVWISIFSLLQLFDTRLSLAPNEIAQHRISAVYNSANSLALFLGPVLLITVGKSIVQKQKQRWLGVSLVVLFSLVMIFTKSKGGLVALIGASFVFLYAYLALKIQKLRKIWWILPIGFVVLSGIFFIYVDGKYHALLATPQVIEHTADTLEIRYFLWSGTLRMLSHHLLFGAGLDGFQTLYANYRYGYAELLPYPHNIFLNFWSETGLMGLLVFFIIMVHLFKKLLHTVYTYKSPYEKIMGMSLIAVLVYWLIHGIVDVPYFKNDLSVEFWVIVALVTLLGHSVTKEQETQKEKATESED